MRIWKECRMIMIWILGIACILDSVVISEAKDTEPYVYTAMGDSIPNGYMAKNETEIQAYPELLSEKLSVVYGREVLLSKYTKNGLSSEKLLQTYLQQEEVRTSLHRSDLITLTIGSNDLLNQFKQVARDILNTDQKFYTAQEALETLQDAVSENPFLLVKCITAIAEWDYQSFESTWREVMLQIGANRKENSQMVVTTIYNPVESVELPSTLNAVVENIISKLNEIIWNCSEEYDYKVVDLFSTEIGRETQLDGLHPNQHGQNLISSLILDKLELEHVVNYEQNTEIQNILEQAKKTAEDVEKTARSKQSSEQVLSILNLFGVMGITVLVLMVERQRRFSGMKR